VTLLAAAAAALAAWLALRPRRVRRLRTKRASVSRRTTLRLVSIALGAAIAIVVGGVAGVAAGVLIALVTPRFLARMESRGERLRRESLERQAPAASDLVAACLAAGATPVDSARAVADALGAPIQEPLHRVVSSLDLGADPVHAWTLLTDVEPLRPMARAVARSAETGAPLATLLAAVAEDQRDEARARAEAMARAAGVRSVAPLAACFLPAFLLIGIVPVVASLAAPLLQ
jgi:Flp pilus assembly protein TadB